MIKRYPKFTFYLLILPALVLFCCLTTSCKTTEDDLANIDPSLVGYLKKIEDRRIEDGELIN